MPSVGCGRIFLKIRSKRTFRMHELLAKKAIDAINAGQFRTAQKHALRGIKQYPNRPEFSNFAGVAAGALGKSKEAVAHFQTAVKTAPAYADARRNLAQTLILMNRPEPALAQLDTLLEANSKDAAASYLRAQALLAMGNTRSALEQIDDLIRSGIRRPRELSMRARIRSALGDESGALSDLEAVLSIDPDHVDTLVAISQPLARAGHVGEAESAVRRAVALSPGNLDAQLRLAAHQEETGQTEAAAATCLSVLDQSPGQPFALEQLARLKGAEQKDRILAEARKALKTAAEPSIQRASLHFALASLAKASADPSDFARNLEKANANMAAFHHYNSDYEENLTNRLIARFPLGTQVSAGPSGSEPRPIFVVGLPRSGTTLTELVLAGNPEVWPLGELGTAGRIAAPIIDRNLPFEEEERAAFASAYVADLTLESRQARARVDKMPENYRVLGFLVTALPDCRIVSLRRDPRDLALSLWQAHFSGSALSYAYDFQAMSHRFNQYARLMNHWKTVFGDWIMEVRYEDLVRETEQTSRRLAAFCGLDWSEAMARPHASAGTVLTLSASQVRQPVHARSVGGWKRHREMLAPFIDGLDKSLWPGLD
ncbi:tetratricopeptide repeat-containing sulfotransferase family protein [Ruegeria sediminis]|uniref:tetratricopeptide repeat-containing sulfotransferase family protein n=1 Tax=Ruegeria sediminis TaxID=2583820 RepID=UPI001C5584F2|nr:tetratricopeptide repeat-containing sulfotransferase family protein [Ruegeria sediminis]